MSNGGPRKISGVASRVIIDESGGRNTIDAWVLLCLNRCV